MSFEIPDPKQEPLPALSASELISDEPQNQKQTEMYFEMMHKE